MTRLANPPKVPQILWLGKKIFYGWVIVAVGSVSQFFTGIVVQGFTTYLSPLQKDFGWSKATLAGPRSIAQIENSILGPLEGFLVDRFGPRRIATAGVFITGLGFILFGLTNSLWMFYLSNIIISLGSGLQGMLIMSVTVNNWFRRRRSIANSVTQLGFSMAGAIAVPALVLTQNHLGWQASATGSGLLIWAVGFPCVSLLRTKPEAHGLLPDGATPSTPSTDEVIKPYQGVEYDFTLREAMSTLTFWLIAVGLGLNQLGLGAVQVHLFLHLEQGIGLTRTMAATVWTVASLANIPSRLLGGFFGDRLPKHLVVGVSMVLMAVAVFILSIATSIEMVFAYALLYGIGWGIRTPVMNALQGEYFGMRSQGVIRGWLTSFALPFMVAAPVVAGYIADIQGSYNMTFIVMSFIMLAGAVLILRAAPPKPPIRRE